jgi:hypothetical protein
MRIYSALGTLPRSDMVLKIILTNPFFFLNWLPARLMYHFDITSIEIESCYFVHSHYDTFVLRACLFTVTKRRSFLSKQALLEPVCRIYMRLVCIILLLLQKILTILHLSTLCTLFGW